MKRYLLDITVKDKYEEGDVKTLEKVIKNIVSKTAAIDFTLTGDLLWGVDTLKTNIQIIFSSQGPKEIMKEIIDALSLKEDCLKLYEENRINKYLLSKEEFSEKYHNALKKPVEKTFDIKAFDKLSDDDYLSFLNDGSLLYAFDKVGVDSFADYLEQNLIYILENFYEVSKTSIKYSLIFDFTVKLILENLGAKFTFNGDVENRETLNETLDKQITKIKDEYAETVQKELGDFFIGERIIEVSNPNSREFSVYLDVAKYFSENYERLEDFIECFRAKPKEVKIEYNTGISATEKIIFIKETLKLLKDKGIIKKFDEENGDFHIDLYDIKHNAFLQGKWFECLTALKIMDIFESSEIRKLEPNFHIYQNIKIQNGSVIRELDVIYTYLDQCVYLENKVNSKAINQDVVKKYLENVKNFQKVSQKIIHLVGEQNKEFISPIQILQIDSYIDSLKKNTKSDLQKLRDQKQKEKSHAEKYEKNKKKAIDILNSYNFQGDVSEPEKRILEDINQHEFYSELSPENLFNYYSQNIANDKDTALRMKQEFEERFLSLYNAKRFNELSKVVDGIRKEYDSVLNDLRFILLPIVACYNPEIVLTLDIKNKKDRILKDEFVDALVYYYVQDTEMVFKTIMSVFQVLTPALVINSKNSKSPFYNVLYKIFLNCVFAFMKNLVKFKVKIPEFQNVFKEIFDMYRLEKSSNKFMTAFMIYFSNKSLETLSTSIEDYDNNYQLFYDFIYKYHYFFLSDNIEEFKEIKKEPFLSFFSGRLNNYLAANSEVLEETIKKIAKEDIVEFDFSDGYQKKIFEQMKNEVGVYSASTHNNEYGYLRYLSPKMRDFLKNGEFLFDDLINNFYETGLSGSVFKYQDMKVLLVKRAKEYQIIAFSLKPKNKDKRYALKAVKDRSALALELDRLSFKYSHKEVKDHLK